MKIIQQHQAFSGHVRFYQHQSQTTQTPMTFAAFIPAGKINNALIWLSGLTCTHENFITKACALEHAARLGTLLICPDTSPRGLDLPGEHDSYDFGSGAGFYVNATTTHYQEHYRMYDYINSELYDLIEKTFDLSEKIGISGHSMGGHGALTIGLKNPNKYQAISAFAPITHPSACDWGKKALRGYLGNDESSWHDYDAVELIRTGHQHSHPILVDQGTSDEFLEHQLQPQALIDACSAHNQALNFNYCEGYDHSYYFISTFIQAHLDFHSQSMTKNGQSMLK